METMPKLRESVQQTLTGFNGAALDGSTAQQTYPVPQVPSMYIPLRSEMKSMLLSKLMPTGKRSVHLVGLVGCGKTWLMLSILHEQQIKERFHDGIFWIYMGYTATPENFINVLKRIYEHVADAETTPRYLGMNDLVQLLSHKLSQKNCILVFDDVWQIWLLALLRDLGTSTVAIGRLRAGHNADQIRIELNPSISATEAVQLMQKYSTVAPKLVSKREIEDTVSGHPLSLVAGDDSSQNLKDMIEIANMVGRHPYSLAILASIVAKPVWNHDWTQFLIMLKEIRHEGLQKYLSQERDPYSGRTTLFSCLQLSIDILDEECADAMIQLSLLAKGSLFTLEVCQCLWQRGKDECSAFTVQLSENSLLETQHMQDKLCFCVHDIVWEYCRSKITSYEELQLRFIDNCYQLYGAEMWRRAPEYIVRYMSYHIHESSLLNDNCPSTGVAFLRSQYSAEAFCQLGKVLEKRMLNQEARTCYEVAILLATKISGRRTEETAVYLNTLGLWYAAQGKYRKAKPCYEESLSIWKDILGSEHPNVAQSLNNLAEVLIAEFEETRPVLEETLSYLGNHTEAKTMHEEALRIRRLKLGNEHPDVAQSLNNVAQLLSKQGKYGEAEPLQREALAISKKALGTEYPTIAIRLNNLAALLSEQGKYSEAEPLYREAVEIWKAVHGENHPLVATGLNNVAQLLKQQGNYDEALPMYYEALAIRENVFGKEHPKYALQLSNIALLLSDQGNYEEAEKLQRAAMEIDKKVYGDVHPDVAIGLNNLAQMLQDQGRVKEALPLFGECLEMQKEVFGEEHPAVAVTLNNVAQLLGDEGRFREALAYQRRALSIRKAFLGVEHQLYASDLNNMAQLLRAQGKLEVAEMLTKESLQIQSKVFGKEHPQYAAGLSNLAQVLTDQGKLAEAQPIHEESLRIRKLTLGSEHPDVAMSFNNIAQLLWTQGNLDEAEKMQREGIHIVEKIHGKHHPDYALQLNNLAHLLKDMGRSNEAKLMGLKAYEIASKLMSKDHPHMQVYSSWNA